jgi:ribosomal protein S18 acetylase RimI-like enzyme
VAVVHEIDRYCDAVPRAAADGEDIGAFTVFLRRGAGWHYYARPRPDGPEPEPGDVEAVLERQAARDVPRAFEWVEETAPWAGPALAAAGLDVERHPMLVLDELRVPGTAASADVRLLEADDPLLPYVQAVQEISFGAGGTDRGVLGTEGLDAAVAEQPPGRVEFARQRIAEGRTRTAAAFVDGRPVAAGAHQPLERVSEIVGVATLPAHRRQGIGAALTAALAADAMRLGVWLIWLSAQDDEVAGIYERLGFRRVGFACEARLPR